MSYLRLRSLIWYAMLASLFAGVPGFVHAQSNSGIVQGTVVDPQKAVVAGAKVRLQNPVSGHVNEVETGQDGMFHITNIPYNPYHLTVTAPGFDTFTQDVDVRSTVPITLEIGLQLGTASTNVTVTENAADVLEVTPTEHTDVDRGLFDTLPLESASSSVSSLITLSSPGVVADSNGNFHGFGDHAENSFSVDGQPITDQQSKVFSNQIPADSIQSMEVIEGAPPAEYGGKTSLVIDVNTRSGLGVARTSGSVNQSYGSFGTSNSSFDVGFGNQKWGDFIAANGLNSGRFLDPPEHAIFHDRGNQENIFDRIDVKLSQADSLQLNLQYTRSRFQTPDSYDQLNPIDPITGNLLPAADQGSYIRTINIAPSWTRIISPAAVFTFGGFVRQDLYTYYPSSNPFSDASPDLQSLSIGQNRSLTNSGARANLSYVKGIHNFKAGATYEQTFLNERDTFGIVDPAINSPCVDQFGNPIGDPTLTATSQCNAGFGQFANDVTNPNAGPSGPVGAPFFLPQEACFDFTRVPVPAQDGCSSNSPFHFQGHTDVKELALYVQDQITKGNWTFNLGIRGDLYNGLSVNREAEPRLGVAYNIKRTNTVLRLSYAHAMESPFNENLVLSSTGCSNPVLFNLLACQTPGASIIQPGLRNEYHAGLQQAFGKYFVLSGEYMWKYTHNAYDFSVFGNTPITFPIAWTRSKIPGFAVRASVPNYHGLTAFVVLSSVAARFFNPQIGGAGTQPGPAGAVFRIDHDERFEQTTHLQYQLPRKRLPWIGLNWRYDSGLVAGPVPCAGGNCNNLLVAAGGQGSDTVVDASTLTADQQFQAGLFCGSIHATPTTPISSSLGSSVCPASQYGSTLLKIPAPGTENDDHNPPRVLPRHLFDVAVGDDNLFNNDRYRWSLRFTVINLTNKVAVYNFLSTFSGTHYVTPRNETVELGFHF